MDMSVIDAYCAAWNETDPDTRDTLLATCWSENGVYTSPVHRALSLHALSDHIAKFHTDQPGAFLKRATDIDIHSGFVRFGWTLHTMEGAQIAEGTSFGSFADDGLIASMTGFFGPL